MIAAIAKSKLRRMARELELRGIRYETGPTMMGRRANPSRQSILDVEGGPSGLPDSNSPFMRVHRRQFSFVASRLASLLRSASYFS